ncbi:MAG TPA: hypothetical protein VM536_22805, partial [Chloroflexia bacterium]|nr:hypothetical protein [Chloroflexia bacterium]
GSAAKGWRHCNHVAVKGRCTGCNAREVPDFVQVAHASFGATPLGSPYLETYKLAGIPQGAGFDRMPKAMFVLNAARRRAA